MTSLPPSGSAPEFTGPLDLLLEEVRQQRVAIEHLAMAPLVARFLAYVRGAQERNLNLDIEWLLVASTLIQWKSRSLLPPDPAQPEPADPVPDELVQQLLAHRKELGEELGRRKTRADASLTRPGERPAGEQNVLEERPDPPFVSVWDLTQQARDLARWTADYRLTLAYWRETFDMEPEPVSVAEMSDTFLKYIRQAESLPVNALPLLIQQPTAARQAALFLGLLKLVQNQQITAEQEEALGELWITLHS